MYISIIIDVIAVVMFMIVLLFIDFVICCVCYVTIIVSRLRSYCLMIVGILG